MTSDLVCPNLENVTERAQMRFKQAVVLAAQMARAELTWTAFGRLLTIMEHQGDLETLGYKSLNACIEEIKIQSGYSRSSMHAFVNLYKAASANGAQVPEMPLGSAHIFKQLPAQLQRDPEVVRAAKELKPKQFLDKMALDHPDAHLEREFRLLLHLDESVRPMWEEFLERVREANDEPDMPEAVAFELEALGPALERLRLERR